MLSITLRRPRAPVLRSMVLRAMACRASSVKVSSTLSMPSSSLYCLTRLLRGSLSTRTSASSSRSSSTVMTGRRPISSGIRPNLTRSWGSTLRSNARSASVELSFSALPKPSADLSVRRRIYLSRPSKAPPQMNRMLVVSIWMNSCCGCLRPPCGGTLLTVPSKIFSSACCTPSPPTSRVMEGFSLLRVILSISSM